jgi:hypothetical protein
MAVHHGKAEGRDERDSGGGDLHPRVIKVHAGTRAQCTPRGPTQLSKCKCADFISSMQVTVTSD